MRVMCIKGASIFLLLMVLVIGMVGCQPGFTAQYTISVSSATGGTVTMPGEGVFRYPAGAVIDLVAVADRGYEFGAWVSNSGTIADINDATTTITLNKNYYFVIASFHD